MTRPDGRQNSQMREMTIKRQFTKYAPGSVYITCGDTHVLCTATIDDKVPRFLLGSGQGWVTAEYSLLPSSTHTRVRREVEKGSVSGRTSEIQRLIGRSLRAAIDMRQLGEKSIYIDCDVIQADGGTRTTAISGAMIALLDAVSFLKKTKELKHNPIKEIILASSVGKVNGEICLDLCYEEDSQAQYDMNVVMTQSGQLIEVQGTAEKATFSKAELLTGLDYVELGLQPLFNTIAEQFSELVPVAVG